MRRSPMRTAFAVLLALFAAPAGALAARPPETGHCAWGAPWVGALRGPPPPAPAEPARGAGVPRGRVEPGPPPAADGTRRTTLDAEHRRFRDEAEDAGVRYRRRFTYKTLFNGVSVSAPQAAAAMIGQLDG